jgi:hypothetical protein
VIRDRLQYREDRLPFKVRIRLATAVLYVLETKVREFIAPDQELAVDDFSDSSEIVATSYNEHPISLPLVFYSFESEILMLGETGRLSITYFISNSFEHEEG